MFFFSGTIDEVASDAPLYWLKYDQDQIINGSIQVDGLLTVEDYHQNSSLINDFNLKEFMDRALRTDDAEEFASLNFGWLNSPIVS